MELTHKLLNWYFVKIKRNEIIYLSLKFLHYSNKRIKQNAFG